MSRIAYTRPSITDLEVDYATDAARNGWGAQSPPPRDQSKRPRRNVIEKRTY